MNRRVPTCLQRSFTSGSGYLTVEACAGSLEAIVVGIHFNVLVFYLDFS